VEPLLQDLDRPQRLARLTQVDPEIVTRDGDERFGR